MLWSRSDSGLSVRKAIISISRRIASRVFLCEVWLCVHVASLGESLSAVVFTSLVPPLASCASMRILFGVIARMVAGTLMT